MDDVLTLRFADHALPYTYTVSRKAFQTYSGWVNAVLTGRRDVSTVDFPLALSYPVPSDTEPARHHAWRAEHPFPPFVEIVAAAREPEDPEDEGSEDEDLDHISSLETSSPPEEYEEVAPNPYAIYARTNAMTQEEADAIPASEFHVLMQEALRFVDLHAAHAHTDNALVSIPRPLRNNSLDGVPQWAQNFINAFYIEADLAALIFIGQELHIEMLFQLANARLALIAKHRHCIGKPEFSAEQDAWAAAYQAAFPELFPEADMATDIVYSVDDMPLLAATDADAKM